MIENPMVIDRYWKDQEQEPECIGECPGCREDIMEGEEVVDFNGVLIHDDHDCVYQYVAKQSVIKVAGE